MRFLPLFKILSAYPFLSFAPKLFGSLEIELELKKFPEIVEIAKQEIKRAIRGELNQRHSLKERGEVMPCFGCDLNCWKCREIGSFKNCDLCLNCFANCKLSYGLKAEEEIKLSAKVAVLRFVTSKLLVSKLEDWARMRYAVNEAEAFSRALENEEDTIVRIVARDLGIKLRDWEVHVSSYVKASSRIRDDDWRLVNRSVSDGYVKTSRPQVIRIIKEFLRARFFEKTDFFVPSLQPHLRDIESVAVRERRVEFDFGEVDSKCFPPCMLEIISEIQRGMNVPHTARFAVTSFLLNIGMSTDEILRLFKSAPDFDEEKSRYQIEHIAGMKGKATKYSAPSCDTMRTYQNCVSNCNVSHPLIFYRNCKKRKKAKA
ncbi:MAG: DNA primase regulatory subunit PriL [Archaeoglobaceae archaeon]